MVQPPVSIEQSESNADSHVIEELERITPQLSENCETSELNNITFTLMSMVQPPVSIEQSESNADSHTFLPSPNHTEDQNNDTNLVNKLHDCSNDDQLDWNYSIEDSNLTSTPATTTAADDSQNATGAVKGQTKSKHEYIVDRGTQEYEDFKEFFPGSSNVYGVVQLSDALSETDLILTTGTIFRFFGSKSAGLPKVFVAGILYDKAAEHDRLQFREGTSSMSLLLVTLGGFEDYVNKSIACENTGKNCFISSIDQRIHFLI